MNDAVLSFDEIRQDFPAPGRKAAIRVVDGISLEVGSGKFVAVIGPSGCGKSTLLQMAAGLLMPTRGQVRHRGRNVDAVNREVGFVPQQAQLFPWKTLAENVELPLLLRGVAAVERRARVAAALDAQTRMVMQDDLQALSRDAGATVLFVTHDITEAVLLADNVAIMSQRPSRLLANIPINLPRPRNVFEPFKNDGYEAAYDAVWSVFRSQIDIRQRTH